MVSSMVAGLVVWIALPVPDEYGTLPPFCPGNIVANMPDGPRQAVGRTLGQLVQEGMPLGQVRWLLGEHHPRLKPIPTGGLVGGVHFARFDYADFGLSVDFLSGNDGVLRVSAVSRRPNRSQLRP